MDELFALQQQLAEIQETSTKYRLSDRIIIDLIEKLVKEYDLKVYHSNDGQSLVTPDQLSKEIHQLIKSQQRIQVNQLHDKLGISFDKIEGQIEKDSNNWDVVRVQDELMSHDYILTVSEEINEDLQQKQIISFQEIMQKYSFPLQFVKKYILEQIGNVIQGVVMEDKLTTITYVEIVTAKLRGILRASINPVSFIKLNKELEIQNSQKICEQLISNKQIEGKIHHGQFLCSKFLQNQESITKKFFEQNSYVEYDMLSQQLLIKSPKDYLKQLFKENVILLDTCGFSKIALQTKQDQIQELLIHEGHTNLQEILPVILTDQDIETLFSLMQLNNCEYSNFFIYYKPYLDNLAAAFKDKMIEQIYQNPQKLIEQTQVQEEAQTDIQASAGGFAKKQKKQQQPQKKKTQQKQELFSQKEITDLLTQKKLVDYNDCNEELFSFLQPRLQILYDQIKIELFESKKSASSQVIQDIQKKIEEMALGLLITQRSLQKIQQECSEVNTKSLVDNFLFGYRLLVENLVVITCKKYNIQLPQNLFADTQNQQQLNFGMQKTGKVFTSKTALGEAIQFLPKEQSKTLKEVMEMYAKKQTDVLTQNQFFEIFNLKVNLDKKNDRNFLLFVKHHCREFVKQNLDQTFDENVFNQIILSMLADSGLYFVGNYDAKFYQDLRQIVYELQQNKQVKVLLHSITNSINQQLEITAETKELLELIKLL